MSQRALTRRGLLTLWKRPETGRPLDLSPLAPAARLSYSLDPAARSKPRPRPETPPLRPPGALPEPDFLDVCRQCGKCVEACPVQAIRPVAEGPGTGTPVISPRVVPCHLCEGLMCTVACPSGALRPLAGPHDVWMGTAVIDAGECLAYRGVPCRACNDVCPVPGVLRLAPGKRAFVPIAGAENCVGCGLCLRYCPSPDAIRIEPPASGSPGLVRVESAL